MDQEIVSRNRVLSIGAVYTVGSESELISPPYDPPRGRGPGDLATGVDPYAPELGDVPRNNRSEADLENVNETGTTTVGMSTADGVYVNYLDDDEENRVRTACGEWYERLVDLKNEWDPNNCFRMNQNIEPTV